jgi:hypothetical protein
MPDIKSPAELGESVDPRRLGFLLREIVVQPLGTSASGAPQ